MPKSEEIVNNTIPGDGQLSAQIFKRPQQTRPKCRKNRVHSPEIHNMCKAAQRMKITALS